MLKRARRTWTIAGSDVENLVHDCTVETGGIRLRTWYKQRDGVNPPGDGEAGDNIFGEELATRLTSMLLTPVGDVTLPWNGDAMRDGAVHYLSTMYDGSAAPAPYRVMEIDAMAALCPAGLRQDAEYPHWEHKQYVYIFDFVDYICNTLGVGIAPAVKIITDGDGSGGFTAADTIIEARLGPLGFVGAFDHTVAGNNVTYRDSRRQLPDGSPNPERGYFSVPSPKPEGWEFG